MIEKVLKYAHLTQLPLAMSLRCTEEEGEVPTGALRVGFVYFQCFRASNMLV